MRRRAFLATVALLAAACAADTAGSTTTTDAVEELSTTTTVVVEPTTANETRGLIDICRPRTVLWESGKTYSASCLALPWSAVAPGDGWRAPRFDNDSLLVSWIDPTDLAHRVNVALLISNHDPEDRLASIVSIDGLDQFGSGSSVVAGQDAIWVDLEGRSLGAGSQSLNDGCAQEGTGGVVFRGGTGNGYWIASAPGGGSPPDSLGVGGCDHARIWVLEVGNSTVTIIGGTADPARHDEAVAKVEELFEGMSFELEGS